MNVRIVVLGLFLFLVVGSVVVVEEGSLVKDVVKVVVFLVIEIGKNFFGGVSEGIISGC